VSDRLQRAIVAVIAVLVFSWGAVLTRNAVLVDAASARLHHDADMPRADWEHYLDQLDGAQLLDPSDDVAVQRAAYTFLRDKRTALRLIEPIVESQPDYLEAWVTMANAARDFDDRAFARALREIRRLNPRPD
jgi:hypothetical protein